MTLLTRNLLAYFTGKKTLEYKKKDECEKDREVTFNINILHFTLLLYFTFIRLFQLFLQCSNWKEIVGPDGCI